MLSKGSEIRHVPTLRLSHVGFDVYREWLPRAQRNSESLEQWLHGLMAEDDDVPPAILLAYAAGRHLAEAGSVDETIFATTRLKVPAALTMEVDVFSAILRILREGYSGPQPSFKGSVAACKYAWTQQWTDERFEYELLCDGIKGLAEKWMETVRQ